MPDRALANMFGGLGEFIKLREGFQQNAKDQAKKDALHKLNMESGELGLSEARAAALRRPVLEGRSDFTFANSLTDNIPSDEAVDAQALKDPTVAANAPAIKAAAAKARTMKAAADANTQVGYNVNSANLTHLQNTNTMDAPKIAAQTEIARRKAAGIPFDPQRVPADRDLAITAGQDKLGGPTYEQETKQRERELQIAHRNRLGEIDAQVAAQNARDVNNLPYGLKDTRQGATIDAAGVQMGASVAAAMKEIVAAQLKITGNLTVKKGGRATDMFGQPLEGVGGTPAAADEQIKIHQQRVRTLAEALRRDASKLINTLVNTQGMEQGQAIAIAKAKINSLLSIVPAMQVQDKNGDWYDVDTRLDVLDQLNLRDKGEYKSRTDPTARIPAIPKETTPTVVATPADTGAGILPGAKRPGQP